MIARVLNKLRRSGLLQLFLAVIKYPFNSNHRKSYKKMLELQDSKERFAEIYHNNLWSSKESRSGPGSETAYTKPLRKWLIDNIPRLNIKEFVDAPCGDFNWMQIVIKKIEVNYIGLDIVDNLIDDNNAKYATSKVCFKVANICEDEIPSCDLVMVRDCLFHLSYNDIGKLLKNLEKTNYKYLLTTTHRVEQGFQNSDIITGSYRQIDLFNKPFNFDPQKITDRVIDDPKVHSYKREMILIEKKFVPTALLTT